MNRVEKAVLYIPCRRCGAKPGFVCRTKTGATYAGRWFAHSVRLRPFEEEYIAGYHAGLDIARRTRKRKKEAAA